MNPEVETSLNRIANRARQRYQSVIGGARYQTVEAANRVESGKKPVRKLSKIGVELTAISHRATAGVVKAQTKMLEHQIDALAGRLHTAARAESLQSLVRDQIRLIPENASRFIEDTRDTISVVRDAGGEVRSLLSDAASDIRGIAKRQTKSSRKAPAKKTRKAAKKTAKTAKKTAKTAAKTVKKTARKASAAATEAVAEA